MIRAAAPLCESDHFVCEKVAMSKSAPLPLVGLHHVARVTSRLEESIAFYRDVLGFA